MDGPDDESARDPPARDRDTARRAAGRSGAGLAPPSGPFDERGGADPLVAAAARVARFGGWALEAATRRLRWTDEVYRLFGIEPGTPVDVARMVGSCEATAGARLLASIEEGLAHGRPIDVECEIAPADGRSAWLGIVADAERADGRVVRLVGAIQDITERVAARQALADGRDRYRGIFDNAADALLIVGLDGVLRDANPKACETYGYSRAEFIGLHGSCFVHPDHQHKFAAAVQSVRGGLRYVVESVDVRKSGEAFPIEVHVSPLDHDGERMMLCSIRDISERRRNEERMREALAVFNASSQAIMTTDASGTILSVNPAFQAITGYSAEEAVGHKPSMLGSGRHEAAHFRAMWQALIADGVWEGEVWNRRKNGQIYVQWQTVSAVRDDCGRIVGYVALFNDITERKRQEHAVWRQANFDTLTGLANRSLFHDRLERALAQARRNQTKVGLLFLDLDDFKAINDTRGHDIGDQLLVEVAARLKGCVRERDTVARLGGDEFTIILHDVNDAADLRPVAEKAIAVLREPFMLAGQLHHVTGSAGLTVFPDDGDTLQALLRNADIAMYKSKQAGRNRLHFYAPQMQAESQLKLRLEAELREAVASGAFVVHYQPIVDADSGELVGAEALLRWQHPQRGLLAPAEFLNVAEDSGLIAPIGEWVLRETAAAWRRWQQPGQPTLSLAVNVAGVQLRSTALAETLASAFADGGCAGLALEISESIVGEGVGGGRARLQALKALGVSFTLDRFGSGFSSLASLKRFGVDTVKIDRRFLHDCPQDRDNAHLVEAIVNMSHSLGLRVAACGVESEAQRAFLRDLGCDYLQGHLIGAPMPAGHFEALARRRRLRHAADGTSLEHSRLLAALRQDDIDIEHWLRRLLAEHSSELADYLEGRGWMSRGLDLRDAVQAHLQCRRCLSDLVLEREPPAPRPPECAGPERPCVLSRWATQLRERGDGRFADLERALAHYHRLAAEIAADCRLGYRDSARRALASVKFRTASRDVLLALVEGFKDAGHTAAAPLGD